MKVIQIQGADYWETIETVKRTEKDIIAYFYGDRKENGDSWCPDCVNGTCGCVLSSILRHSDSELYLMHTDLYGLHILMNTCIKEAYCYFAKAGKF